MQVLDLQHPEHSNIKYKIIHFPDGELQLDIETPLINFKDEINIKTRIKSADDLFILLQAQDILDRHCIDYYTDIMYLMTQRTDRLFSYGRPLSLKIIMNLLNGPVYILEPHNYEAMQMYKEDNLLGRINYRHQAFSCPSTYMFPDKGAMNRYLNDYEKIHKFFLYGEKFRDVKTGNITDYEVFSTFTSDYVPDKITIIDDLCDGGRTFITAYDKIKEQYPNAEINLEVVHAVQLGGLQNVCNKFNTVTVTNSYADWENLKIDNLKVIDVWNID